MSGLTFFLNEERRLSQYRCGSDQDGAKARPWKSGRHYSLRLRHKTPLQILGQGRKHWEHLRQQARRHYRGPGMSEHCFHLRDLISQCHKYPDLQDGTELLAHVLMVKFSTCQLIVTAIDQAGGKLYLNHGTEQGWFSNSSRLRCSG